MVLGVPLFKKIQVILEEIDLLNELSAEFLPVSLFHSTRLLSCSLQSENKSLKYQITS